MESNPELVKLSDEDKKKLMQAKQEKKWSITMFGMEVPIWILVVVVVVVVYILHKNGYLSTIEKKAVEFSEGTRRMLDKVTKKVTTSTTSPMMSENMATGASSKVTAAATEAVKTQLRHLFNNF
jgi:hypothetical protein